MAHTRMCAIDANNERASLTGTVLKMCRCRLPIRMDMREFLVVLGRRKSVAHNTGTDKKKNKPRLSDRFAAFQQTHAVGTDNALAPAAA